MSSQRPAGTVSDHSQEPKRHKHASVIKLLFKEAMILAVTSLALDTSLETVQVRQGASRFKHLILGL